MSYAVFLVEEIGAPRNHHAIFVETDNPNGAGQLYQVTGNIQTGMEYETKAVDRPESRLGFLSKISLGVVSTANYSRINTVCAGIPAPKKQFDGPARLYPEEPLRRCQEWTAEAVKALKESGIVEQ